MPAPADSAGGGREAGSAACGCRGRKPMTDAAYCVLRIAYWGLHFEGGCVLRIAYCVLGRPHPRDKLIHDSSRRCPVRVSSAGGERTLLLFPCPTLHQLAGKRIQGARRRLPDRHTAARANRLPLLRLHVSSTMPLATIQQCKRLQRRFVDRALSDVGGALLGRTGRAAAGATSWALVLGDRGWAASWLMQHTYTHIHTHMHVHIHVYICDRGWAARLADAAYAHTYMCTYMHACTCTHTCIHR